MPNEVEPGTAPRTPERIAIDIAIRLGGLLVFVYVSLTLVGPFAGILVWSCILTVATYPVFAWLRARLGFGKLLSASFVTIVMLVLVFGPIAALASSLVLSLERFAEHASEGGLVLPALPPFVNTLPVIGPMLESNWTLAGSDSSEFLKKYAHTVAIPGEWVLHAIEGLAGSVLVFAVSVIVSGFLLTRAPELAGLGRTAAMRLAGPHGKRFVDLAGVTIQNIAQGVIGVAVIQAIAVGVALLVTGVPHAGLLAVVTLVLAISQIGPGVVILPLVIWFWVTKDWTLALPFTLAMLPVYALESIGKPLLMSRGLTTPTFVILIGVLGGTVVYGLPGLFLGPIVLTVFYELVLLWIAQERLPEDVPAETAEGKPDA
jgi:predicted PurR-regulated permease PerM